MPERSDPDLSADIRHEVNRPGSPAAGSGPFAVSALVQSANWRLALDLVLHDTLDGRETPPDVVLLFASDDYASDYPELLREIHERSGTSCLVGSSCSGALANGASIESDPCLAMMCLWLPGATLTPVRLHQTTLDVLDDPELWSEMHGPPPEETRAWLVFADPFRMDAQEMVAKLSARYPGTPIMGGTSSTTGQDRRVWVFFDDQVYDEGGVALAIGGPYELQIVLSQGADPIGEPWTVTGVERNRITTISNRPAADVMQATIDALPPEARPAAERNLLVGFPIDEYRHEFHRGEFVVRGILGVDEKRGALIVGSIPRAGQTIQFQQRDARSSSLDLQQMLVDARATGDRKQLVAGLLCTCKGRGAAMFGRPNHDAMAVQSAFRGLPVAGMFSFGEIGPVHGKTVLNSFTAILGLLTYRPGRGRA
jgi:small ligand-binding sensory domain FIST